jgi:hypothetical protein
MGSHRVSECAKGNDEGPVMTSGADYGELTVSQLVEMINTEYAAILETERTTLQRAIGIGEKLIDLKPRVAKHGEWQAWLKSNCPKISLETANLYMRLAKPENLAKLEKAAAIKSVSVTDLTTTEARDLLANKSFTNTTNTSSTKSSKVVKGGVAEPGNEPQPATIAPDTALEGLANDEVFHTLWNVYQNRQADLLDLTAKLAGSLGMTLMPLPETAERLKDVLGVPEQMTQ